MSQRCKASPAQLRYLAEYMANHQEIASGLCQSLQGRAELETAWQSLTTTLNSLGGPMKTTAKWKQAWRDLKNNVKKKASHNIKEFRGYGPGSTGNGPSTIKDLSEVEEQVFSVMGPVAVFGMEEVATTEVKEYTVSPGPSQTPKTGVHEKEKEEQLPVLPEPKPTQLAAQARKRKRIVPKHDSFDSKLLAIEEEKLKIKRRRNEIEEERNVLLNRDNRALCKELPRLMSPP